MLIAMAQVKGLSSFITEMLTTKGMEVATRPNTNNKATFLKSNISHSKFCSELQKMNTITQKLAKNNSTNVMVNGSMVLTNLAFIEENTEAKKAANKDHAIPKAY